MYTTVRLQGQNPSQYLQTLESLFAVKGLSSSGFWLEYLCENHTPTLYHVHLSTAGPVIPPAEAR